MDTKNGESGGPLSQFPQLIEGLLTRIEDMLAGQPRNEASEKLFGKLRKQLEAMRAIAKSSTGENLTPEQVSKISNVQVPQAGLFPQWANRKEDNK